MGHLFLPLHNYCHQLQAETAHISTARKSKLAQLAEYISDRLQNQQQARVIVICTHNSRRSHLAQLWLAVIADYLGLLGLETFSGGTEATALNPRVVTALRRVGFEVSTTDAALSNPIYDIRWSADTSGGYRAFSKRYDSAPNPQEAFAAVMVCNEADEACPIVSGADVRIALPFDDPKNYDDTPREADKYLERCRDIGREMMYVLEQLRINAKVSK